MYTCFENFQRNYFVASDEEITKLYEEMRQENESDMSIEEKLILADACRLAQRIADAKQKNWPNIAELNWYDKPINPKTFDEDEEYTVLLGDAEFKVYAKTEEDAQDLVLRHIIQKRRFDFIINLLKQGGKQNGEQN